MEESDSEMRAMTNLVRAMVLVLTSAASCCTVSSQSYDATQSVRPAATADKPTRTEEESADAPRQPISLSADHLIQILRSNPDTIVEAKSLLADSMQAEADPTAEPGDPSDDQLFLEIQQSPEARARLTRFLLARGYLSDEDSALLRSRSNAVPAFESEASTNAADDLANENDGSTGAPLQLEGQAGTVANSRRIPRKGAQRRSTPMDRLETAPPKDEPNVTDEPATLRRPAPYNLRALRELYTQVPDLPDHLKRFGSELFTRRSSSSADLPVGIMDVPLGPEYVLGPGDELSIAIWGGISQNLMRAVDRNGRVNLPEIGPLQVAGLTLGRAEEVVAQTMQPQFRNAHVSLTVARLRSIQIFVVGDVQRPGAVQMSALASPITALLSAGGPTSHGSLRIVQHLRGDKLIEQIDLYDFFLHGVRSPQSRLEAGDTLLVPPAGAQVAVFGAVKRPAIYELRDEKTLDAILADAGGLTVAAELSQITVSRLVENLHREEVSLGGAAEGPEVLRSRFATFGVKDGDRIHVGTVAPSSDRVIYLQGHVVRPGRIGYRDGMQLSDVLRSYRDLLPEPAQTGEIVRLMAPDLHPETVEFNVADVLIGNGTLPLQPFDTVRVFGRYEQDAPMVTVRGEVKRPGAYPLFEGMTAAQLVRAAGGFKRDALLENADLVSYRAINGTGVSIERREVPIGAAVLHEDRTADSPLKPGDVLTVHQLTGWSDIGASITLDGEIAHPGSYGLREGEHLSDVLRRAGGFRGTAYPEGALLTRPEVAKLEERNREEIIRQIETSSSAARMAPAAASSDKAATLQMIQQQQDQILADLRKQPALGRLVIHIDAQIQSWAGTPADVELRNGDVLRIPKRPGFVLVSGQVYNPSAITFQPGKSAEWYLQHAGGATSVANRKEIFIVRANGSVIGRRSSTWYQHDVLSTRLNPGDAIIVPQKILGPANKWKNILATAQVAASLAIAAAVAGL